MSKETYNDPAVIFSKLGLDRVVKDSAELMGPLEDSLSAHERKLVKRALKLKQELSRNKKATLSPDEEEKATNLSERDYLIIKSQWLRGIEYHVIENFASSGYASLEKETRDRVFMDAIRLAKNGIVDEVYPDYATTPERRLACAKFLAWTDLYGSSSQEEILGRD